MWFYGNTVAVGSKVERNYGASEAYDLHLETAGAEAAQRIAEVQRRLALLISEQGLGRDYHPSALVGDLFTALASPVDGGAAASRISYAGKGVKGTLRYHHEDVPSDMHVEAHNRWEVRLTLRGEESPFFTGVHQVLMEYIDREREKREMSTQTSGWAQ